MCQAVSNWLIFQKSLEAPPHQHVLQATTTDQTYQRAAWGRHVLRREHHNLQRSDLAPNAQDGKDAVENSL
eukprot:scaffold184977_cov46-Prasinocladus_malaysianus.AAC.2